MYDLQKVLSNLGVRVMMMYKDDNINWLACFRRYIVRPTVAVQTNLAVIII